MGLIDYSIYTDWRKRFKLKNSRFQCANCNELLLQPYQTECGVRYCYVCINEFNDLKTCPGCHKGILSLQENIIPDKAIEREILKLEINCINGECKESPIFKELKDHLEICKYRKERCCHCNESYFFVNKQEHLAKDCKKLIIKCPDCDEELMREQLEAIHRNLNVDNINELCSQWRTTCPHNCCDVVFDSIRKHLEICPKHPMKCLLWNIGCRRVVTDELMNDHIKNDEIHHLSLLTNFLLDLRTTKRDRQLQLVDSERSFSSKIDDIKQSTLASTNQISHLTATIVAHRSDIERMKTEIRTIDSRRATQPVCDSNKNPIRKLVTLANVVEFVWTITDIREKIADAKNNCQQSQTVSDPFYLADPGYRIRLKIYPNGDGSAKHRALSIFFVIVKGDYDDIIPWPFAKKVTLCVAKYNSTIGSTKVVMKPSFNQSCYGKPTSECNVGSGQPDFVRISDLLNGDELITDGSLQIKFSAEL